MPISFFTFGGLMLKRLVLAAALLAAPLPVSAQMVSGKVVASNGVEVDRHTDDFAGRAEYSAPSISFRTTGSEAGFGFAIVAKVKDAGKFGRISIQGSILYSGDWQYFDSAIFRGGEAVEFKRTDGKVGDCRNGCTLTDSYMMYLTPEQMKKYAQDGVVTVQIRAAKSGSTGLVNIPVKYIDAVNEVAK